MITKGILIMGLIVINLFGFFTRTIGVCVTLSLFIISMYIIFKYSTRNTPYKKRISVAQDFLKHKYGDKMGDYILKESMKRKKNHCIIFLSVLMVFVLFIANIPITVQGSDEYYTGFEDGVLGSQYSNGFIETYHISGGASVSNAVSHSGTNSYGAILGYPHTWGINYTYDNISLVMCASSLWWYSGDPTDTTDLDYKQGNTDLITFTLDASKIVMDTFSSTITVYFSDTTHAQWKNWGWYTNNFEKITVWVDNINTGNSSSGTPKIGSLLDRHIDVAIWNTDSTSCFIDDYQTTIDIDYLYKNTIYNTVFFEIYDLKTSKQLHIYGDDYSGTGIIPYINTEIHSTLWEGDYNSAKDYGTTVTLENLDIPVDGSWHWFNFTDANGIISVTYTDGGFTSDYRIYPDSNNYLKVYPSQTFTIYITDIESGGFDYTNCKTFTTSDKLFCELCTDKYHYTQGESINFRYKVPSSIELSKIWWRPHGAYYLWIYDVSNLGWLFGLTDGGKSADNGDYLDNYKLSLDNTYNYLFWHYDDTGETGYNTITGGFNKYKAYLGHTGGGLFGTDYCLVKDLGFMIEGGIFSPSGNITSVSPVSPEIGQKTTIAFDVNNNGYITVKNLLSPDETEVKISTFAKFSGTSNVNYTFWEYGEYLVNLYVNGGLEYTAVDTNIIAVTTLNGTYGGFGYNIEYLTVEPARVIAGFDTIYINYRCLKDNGNITVVDSRGQQTPFSSTIGVKTGVLNIQLPNYAEIGKWNITLNGNTTLYSNFHVVAEENNWVEFNKNVFYDNEPFEIELKHDKKIEVVFYKDNVAYGSDWYLESGLFSSGIFTVPFDKAVPEIGKWKVEIWEVNHFIKIQKLAEDTCIVIETPVDVGEIVVSDDITDYMQNIDPFYKGLIGIFIVLVCTFMPFLAIKEMGKHNINFKVDIPPMLYTVCSGVGAVVSLMLGVWIVEYTFFICVMAGFGTMALYLVGKRNGSE